MASLPKSATPMIAEAAKWVLILGLTVVLAIAGAAVKQDVYSKDEVDSRVGQVKELHLRDVDGMQRQIDSIDENVKWLVRSQGGTPVEGDN